MPRFKKLQRNYFILLSILWNVKTMQQLMRHFIFITALFICANLFGQMQNFAGTFILMIVGVVQLTRSDLIKKKNGKKLLLIGIGLLGVELLIGYSICSNMNFAGGMH